MASAAAAPAAGRGEQAEAFHQSGGGGEDLAPFPEHPHDQAGPEQARSDVQGHPRHPQPAGERGTGEYGQEEEREGEAIIHRVRQIEDAERRIVQTHAPP